MLKKSSTEKNSHDLNSLWFAFSDVPINTDDEIETEFLHFEKGTDRFEVWKWFESLGYPVTPINKSSKAEDWQITIIGITFVEEVDCNSGRRRKVFADGSMIIDDNFTLENRP